MMLNCYLLWILIILPYSVYGWFEVCDNTIYITNTMYIVSPGYPYYYHPRSSCRYHIIAPLDYEINIECNIYIEKGTSSSYCGTEYFYISTAGDKQLRGSEYICGSGYIQRKSLFNRMTIAYTSSSDVNSGAFKCLVSIRQQPCNCGWSMGRRIVGGIEAKITEFPFMAALMNSNGDVFCGGSIISHKHILTAAHCLNVFIPVKVVVGEHDLKTAAETPYTQHHYVNETLIHDLYNPTRITNDIAIVTTITDMQWSLGVGPICLPFLYTFATFEGMKPDISGWGTTSFSGPSSTVLLKTTVNVVNNAVCDREYPYMSQSQICTYTPGHDSCQLDSGGPVCWKSKNLQLIGIISYGKICGQSPGVNTRITSYLPWIMNKTREIYCEMP